MVASTTTALETETQTWTTATAYLPLADASTLKLRYRARFSGPFDKRRLQQYRVRFGHRINDRLSLDAGYEYSHARLGTLENRYLAQAQVNSTLWGLPLRHRLRAEIRDLALRDNPAYRLRYLIGHRREFRDGRSYLELRNEIFVSLSEGALLDRGFDQNRIGVTLGRHFGSGLAGEFRYQWRYLDNSLIERGDHLIQFHVIWDGR